MSWIWMALAGLLSGLLGAMGMGGGGVLIIYLTLVAGMEQRAAQGVNLLLFIPCAIVALIIYLKKHLIKWRTALLAAGFGLLGALLGTWLSGTLDISLLKKIFGGMLAIVGIIELFGNSEKKKEEN